MILVHYKVQAPRFLNHFVTINQQYLICSEFIEIIKPLPVAIIDYFCISFLFILAIILKFFAHCLLCYILSVEVLSMHTIITSVSN